jgi:hypothetical protein
MKSQLSCTLPPRLNNSPKRMRSVINPLLTFRAVIELAFRIVAQLTVSGTRGRNR